MPYKQINVTIETARGHAFINTLEIASGQPPSSTHIETTAERAERLLSALNARLEMLEQEELDHVTQD